MLVPVPANEVGEWWDKAAPEIERAVKRGGRYSVQSVKDAILDRRMQLWLAVENGEVICVCVTEILVYPLCKVLSVFITTGRDYRKWADYMLALNEWAKANGCTMGESWARRGWFRILKHIITGLRRPHEHLEWDIG